jgi:transposase
MPSRNVAAGASSTAGLPIEGKDPVAEQELQPIRRHGAVRGVLRNRRRPRTHHAVALDPYGQRLADRPLPNSEPALVKLFEELESHGRVLVVSLGEEHTRKVSQLHALLLELLPGGAKNDLSAAQAKALLAKVRPRDLVGKTRRRLAAELVGDLEQIHTRKKAADKELKALVAATGTGLPYLYGIGPSGAARLLVEVADITRFPDRNHFASWTGTAPIDASSGDHVRHRLSRGGNRQINRVLHTMATVQLRNATDGRVYFDRKKADGKSSNQAMRCLKRRLSDAVYRVMVDDLAKTTSTAARTDPGGRPGNDSYSSATSSQPKASSSDKPLPGPVTTKPRTPLPAAS